VELITSLEVVAEALTQVAQEDQVVQVAAVLVVLDQAE
jgi:hypothetical protein